MTGTELVVVILLMIWIILNIKNGIKGLEKLPLNIKPYYGLILTVSLVLYGLVIAGVLYLAVN